MSTILQLITDRLPLSSVLVRASTRLLQFKPTRGVGEGRVGRRSEFEELESVKLPKKLPFMKVSLRLTPLILLSLWCAASLFAQAAPDPSLHLYLLVGQSNMAGRGSVDEESKRSDERVVVLTKEFEWLPATDPLHFDKPVAGVGPGLAFGKAMAAKTTGVRIGLIPCAVGGTSIRLWVPDAFDPVTRTHPYSDMLERVKVAQKAGVLKGVLWHQGESDLNASDSYGEQLRDLIERIRKDCATGAPFVAGEVSSFVPNTQEPTRKLNAAIHGLEGQIPNYGWVSSEGLGHKGDKVHYDTASARALGERYAEKMTALQK
jgi:hypothetical protein